MARGLNRGRGRNIAYFAVERACKVIGQKSEGLSYGLGRGRGAPMGAKVRRARRVKRANFPFCGVDSRETGIEGRRDTLHLPAVEQDKGVDDVGQHERRTDFFDMLFDKHIQITANLTVSLFFATLLALKRSV